MPVIGRSPRIWCDRALLLSLGAVGLLAFVSAGQSKGTAVTKPAAVTVFRLAQQEPPDPFDPATLSDNRSIELAQNVFDGLTKVNEKGPQHCSESRGQLHGQP